MGFAVRLAVAVAVFWLDAAVAQEGYFGHDHEKWHHGFYQTLERPDTKSPCCNLTDCRQPPTLDFTSVLLSNSMGNPITYTVSLSRQKFRPSRGRPKAGTRFIRSPRRQG